MSDDPIADLPVAASVLGAAFNLPPDLDVVSYHRGAFGAWRLRSASSGDEWSLKALAADAPSYGIEPIRDGGELERRALAAGLEIAPPLEPIVPALGFAARIGDKLAWMHRWIDGSQVDDQAPLPSLDAWVGETVAGLHGLIPARRDRENALEHAYGLHPRQAWQGWFDEADDGDLAWTALGPIAMPVIAEASALVRAALGLRDLPRCISHRDVNPANVLVGPNGPTLIDFSYTGIEAPWLEAVDAAHAFGQADATTLEAYLRYGGQPGPQVTEALARDCGGTLNQLASTMRRSLGHRQETEEERAETTGQVPELVANLTRQVESLESLGGRLFGR